MSILPRLLPLMLVALPCLADDDAQKLRALFDAEWEHTMETSPTWASQLGDRRWNDRWPDLSLETIEREHARDEEVVGRIKTIRRDALSAADQLNYDMFRLNYEHALEGFRFGGYLMPLDQRAGIQTEDELGDALRFETAQDYDDWISRLWAFGGYMDQTIALMREGMRRGLVQPKITMQRVPAQIDKQLVSTPEESPFFKPLTRIPPSLPAAEQERLTTAARAAVRDTVLPAFQRFREFFTGEYLPACLDGIGASRWPDGDAMYAFLAREYTTTQLTPQEIHDIGQREVARIRGEMEKVKARAGFAGTLPEFFTFLRTDPRFYCADEKQLLLEYQATAKRIDPTLVKLFRTLPRAPYGVEAIPAKTAPDTTAAYYRPLAADGSRAGTYFVNLYKPESRPRWEMMALSLHESVPGHHLQFALAQEQGELPRFRQHASYTGYVEGWALYAESLGDELGLYDDPYSKFGQLTYEMWRAVRLVVDTGIHAFHWDREKAIAFFRENAPKSEQDIVNEVDRYISWPGQALAYKIGELKIKELRARAVGQLGASFDLKEFHDVILLGGAMPLSLLEQRVDEWLRSKKARSAAQPRPRLQIINGSSEPIDIFWLETATKRRPNGSLETGKQTVISTTIGHRFVIVGRESKTEATVASEVPVQGFRFGGVPAFYTQRVEAHGFPIVASANVNPYALKEAAYLADLMLANRADVRAAMIKSGARMCVMAWNEFTTDLPEWSHLTPKDYRDARARGMGGSETDPYCSCAEENVLGYPGDPYSTECIVIHEFAHNIHLRGMVNVDPTFDARLKATYDAAMKAGLWKGKYAATNHHEYFAEGVQSWFDNNRVNDHDHNHVNTRALLLEYDPGLAAMCREVFGDTVIKYTKPATRLTGHMAGYDPAKAPTFVWPERLANAKAEIRAKTKARNEGANGRETREVAGWSVHISKALFSADQAATEHALELLKKMLDEIIRVVPAKAVVELQMVPLYFSPAYPGKRGGAEFHPDAGWLRDNGRDPVMAKGVEFSNIANFEQELNRMPNFALHELAHAFHNRVVRDGFGNAEIKTAYEHAKAAGKYDRVERWHGNGKANTLERAYAMTNPMEYFAECSEAFFSRNDFFPFTRDELKQHDPEMFAVLEKLWSHPTE